MAAGECEAAEKAAARTAERQIRQAFAPFSQEIAARIGVARQQQLMGTPEDSSDPFEDIEERLCQLYQTHVAPRWSQAAVNCALAKVLLQFSIGLQRQLSLLGNEYTCIDMGTTTMCVLFNNCLQEIRECCEAGNKGSTKIAEILGVVRQDAFDGGNCISESDAQEAFDICSSNVWTGTYSVQAIGYTNITHSDAFSTRVHIDDFVSTFTGSVIESTESGSAANGYIVQLRVAGEITVSDFSMDSTDFKTECGSRYRIVSSRIVAAAPTQYTVTLSTRPDGSYVVSSFNRTDTHFGAPAVKTSIELDSAQSCEEGASEIVKNKTMIAAAGVFGPSLPTYQGRWNDQHAISGNNAMVDTGRDPDRKLTEQWSFSRQTVP